MAIVEHTPHEAERLTELESFHILDSPAEREFDDITFLASSICGTPVALVTLLTDDRQWFKSKVGTALEGGPRDQSFCTHALDDPGHVMVVNDASSDPRFAENPLVTGGQHIRFYAGAPLVTRRGHVMGTLCVLDRVPRELDATQLKSLKALARKVVTELELRRTLRELERAYTVIAEQNVTDALTGLSNRREFDSRLAEEVERSRRSGRPLSVALIDIDHFKDFNDTFGHQAGDETLRTVAQLIGETSRAGDLAARYGGEEFVVIMPDTPPDGAARVAERIRVAIESRSGDERPVTASLGVATTMGATTPGDELVEAADQALYRAKERGRNRVETA